MSRAGGRSVKKLKLQLKLQTNSFTHYKTANGLAKVENCSFWTSSNYRPHCVWVWLRRRRGSKTLLLLLRELFFLGGWNERVLIWDRFASVQVVFAGSTNWSHGWDWVPGDEVLGKFEWSCCQLWEFWRVSKVLNQNITFKKWNRYWGIKQPPCFNIFIK